MVPYIGIYFPIAVIDPAAGIELPGIISPDLILFGQIKRFALFIVARFVIPRNVFTFDFDHHVAARRAAAVDTCIQPQHAGRTAQNMRLDVGEPRSCLFGGISVIEVVVLMSRPGVDIFVAGKQVRIGRGIEVRR